jgi:16S rRNA (uracil1498-N3)-methyltransferase
MKHTFRYLVAESLVAGGQIVLGEADSHHLARVVRRRAGDTVEVIDADGNIWPAMVRDPAASNGAVLDVGVEPRPSPPSAPFGLAIGALESNRLDLVVEKAAEMGVPRIVVLAGERARRGHDGEAWRRRRERLQRVADAAARQSGRGRTPTLEGPRQVGDVLGDRGIEGSLMLDPRGTDSLAMVTAPARGATPLVFVGPEAGFSAEEVAAAQAHGLAVCGLGSAILRAETAAIVGLAIVFDRAGYFTETHATAIPEPS